MKNKDYTFSNERLRNIKRAFGEKTGVSLNEMKGEMKMTTIKKRPLKLVLITAMLVAVLATSAFAFSDTIQKFFFGTYTERADMTARYDADVLINDYTLEFSSFDEIRSLFNISLGNPFMDDVRRPHNGVLSVTEWSDQSPSVSITSYFSVGKCNFKATIFVPLEADENWGVAYADYAAADPEIKYLYESRNGIIARVIIDQRALPEWTMDVRFVYDGAYYILESDSLMQTSDGSTDLDNTVAMYLEAFQ